MPYSKIELYAAIRRDARAGITARAIERKHGAGLAAPRKQRHTVTRIWWPEGDHQSSTRRQTSVRGRLAAGATAIST
jgi:hypothetical protein